MRRAARASTKTMLYLSGLALFSACETKDDQPAPSLPAASTAEAIPRPATQPIATNEELQALVDRWQRSQNEGNYDAYAALYAKKFTGIKRSADRARHFDRATWLADRRSMFAKPFTVVITSSTLNAMPGFAMVSFEQRWKSDTYEDRGRKQLLLVREDGRLLISREEMLASKTAVDQDITVPSFEQATLARKTSHGFALLLKGPVDISWATEHPVYLDDTQNERAVALAALPAPTRALLNQDFEVFDASGKRCEAKPTRFKILTYIIPHFGVVNLWTDFAAKYENRAAQPYPPAARAAMLWGMAIEGEGETRGRTLGIEFDTSSACPEPVWGRKLSPGAPTPAVVRPAQANELDELVAALPHHPAVIAFNAQLASDAFTQGSGWGSALPGTARVVDAGNGTELLYVQATGVGGCGYPTPESAGFLWRRQLGKLSPLGGSVDIEGFLRAALDVNGDGELELMGDEQILGRGQDGYEVVVDHSALFLDCPC